MSAPVVPGAPPAPAPSEPGAEILRLQAALMAILKRVPDVGTRESDAMEGNASLWRATARDCASIARAALHHAPLAPADGVVAGHDSRGGGDVA